MCAHPLENCRNIAVVADFRRLTLFALDRQQIVEKIKGSL